MGKIHKKNWFLLLFHMLFFSITLDPRVLFSLIHESQEESRSSLHTLGGGGRKGGGVGGAGFRMYDYFINGDIGTTGLRGCRHD